MPLNNPIANARVNYGSYAGNQAANRGITHGLAGAVPKIVMIYSTQGYKEFFRITRGLAYIESTGDHTIAPNAYAVTAPDSTYFYVGDGVNHIRTANENAYTYYWVAIG